MLLQKTNEIDQKMYLKIRCVPKKAKAEKKTQSTKTPWLGLETSKVMQKLNVEQKRQRCTKRVIVGIEVNPKFQNGIKNQKPRQDVPDIITDPEVEGSNLL
ncbi:hypothetical protein DPMN_033659 [Dreissena polymorpha]|uniref:Uncharacterized protein n=1 Tax=Dreissena polymorpha TaxID=45954 RepID=A0A9D4M6G2_DREPO|nr:hypothetical protein DPMN_033659 [Dreissena polymorpha]